MSQHTPGPYSVGQYGTLDDTGNKVEQLAIYGADGVKIAVVETWLGDQERAESEANAHLIAAAPELFEALLALGQATAPFISVAIGSRNRNVQAAINLANAAIRKAEGRP